MPAREAVIARLPRSEDRERDKTTSQYVVTNDDRQPTGPANYAVPLVLIQQDQRRRNKARMRGRQPKVSPRNRQAARPFWRPAVGPSWLGQETGHNGVRRPATTAIRRPATTA